METNLTTHCEETAEPLPQVSVVVPTCNRAASLRLCLEGLAQQTGPRYEVIVVDDGSRDETPATVAGVAGAHPDLVLRYLANPGNLGANASRNRGIHAARGPLVAFTDDDCVPAPDWLAALVAVFADTGVAAATGLVLSAPPRNLYERTLKGTQRVVGRGAARRLVGCNMCIRRELLLRYPFDEDRAPPQSNRGGGPDMRVSGRGDEEALGLTLRAAGYPLRVAAAARVTHRHPHDGHSFFRQALLGGRSAARIVYKFHLPPRLDLLPLLLGYLTLPFGLWAGRLALLPGLCFIAALGAITYNDLFRKGKTLADTIITFPLLVAYYHVRLGGYVFESLRLRLCPHDLRRQRLPRARPHGQNPAGPAPRAGQPPVARDGSRH